MRKKAAPPEPSMMTVSPFANGRSLSRRAICSVCLRSMSAKSLHALQSGHGVARRRAGRRCVAARLPGGDGATLEEVERPVLERPFDVAPRAVDLLALQGELAQSAASWASSRQSWLTCAGGTCSSKVPPFGSERIAMRLRPALRSSTWPARSRRKWSGTTRPATTASPRPQLASIKRSSAPVTGFSVNMTPAAAGLRSVWTTTPTLGRVNRPTRWR